MLCLHCSLPTSDPRGTRAEGTDPFAHRHKLDPQGPPVTLRKPMAARRAAPKSHQKATEGSPAHPGDPRTGTPAQQAQPPRRSKCARNDRAAHIRRRTRRARLPPPASEQRTTRRGTARHTTAMTAPPETQQRPYAILRSTGKSPVLTSRPPPGRPDRASPS